MRKTPALIVAIALSAAIVVAATFLIATETRGDGRPPVSILTHPAR